MVKYSCGICGQSYQTFDEAGACEKREVEAEFPIPLGSVFRDSEGFFGIFYDSVISKDNPHIRNYIVGRASNKPGFSDFAVVPEIALSLGAMQRAVSVTPDEFEFVKTKLADSLAKPLEREPPHVTKLRNLELISY